MSEVLRVLRMWLQKEARGDHRQTRGRSNAPVRVRGLLGSAIHLFPHQGLHASKAATSSVGIGR
jgi:hypothetical protein